MSINQPRNHQKHFEPAHLVSVNLAIASRNAREMTSTVLVASMIFPVKCYIVDVSECYQTILLLSGHHEGLV